MQLCILWTPRGKYCTTKLHNIMQKSVGVVFCRAYMEERSLSRWIGGAETWRRRSPSCPPSQTSVQTVRWRAADLTPNSTRSSSTRSTPTTPSTCATSSWTGWYSRRTWRTRPASRASSRRWTTCRPTTPVAPGLSWEVGHLQQAHIAKLCSKRL